MPSFYLDLGAHRKIKYKNKILIFLSKTPFFCIVFELFLDLINNNLINFAQKA